MRWTAIPIVAIFILGLCFSRCGGDANRIDTVACPIEAAVSKIRIADSYYNKKAQLKTRVFYRANENQRAWLKKRRPDKMFDAFVAEVEASTAYGFSPEDYHIDRLQSAVAALYDNRKRTNADISALDIRITAAFFLFTTHLLEGRVRYPGARAFYWERGMPLENDIALLVKMESASDLRKEIAALQPDLPQYRKLQQALKQYRARARNDTMPPLPTHLHLKPGARDKRVPLLRTKLAILGAYDEEAADSLIRYDGKLAAAVKTFQERHGIEPNGVIDAETIRILNEPVAEKIARIVLNLERLRWHPRMKGDGDEIVINVPEYMLRVYHNNRMTMEMRVVLGSGFTPTPIFHDTLKYIVFSPQWMVPKSIFEAEFFPRLKEDGGHFDPEKFRFFEDGKEIDPTEVDWEDKKLDITRYRAVEKPWDGNALGKVKFIMPNDFSVYLHDTPAGQLFSREARALSHGCIRLEKPAAFAAYLLDGQKGWDEEKIRTAMNAGEPRQVHLEKTYPVYIVYHTAWVDDNGRVAFRPDIYGHDKRQLAELTKAMPEISGLSGGGRN